MSARLGCFRRAKDINFGRPIIRRYRPVGWFPRSLCVPGVLAAASVRPGGSEIHPIRAATGGCECMPKRGQKTTFRASRGPECALRAPEGAPHTRKRCGKCTGCVFTTGADLKFNRKFWPLSWLTSQLVRCRAPTDSTPPVASAVARSEPARGPCCPFGGRPAF